MEHYGTQLNVLPTKEKRPQLDASTFFNEGSSVVEIESGKFSVETILEEGIVGGGQHLTLELRRRNETPVSKKLRKTLEGAGVRFEGYEVTELSVNGRKFDMRKTRIFLIPSLLPHHQDEMDQPPLALRQLMHDSWQKFSEPAERVVYAGQIALGDDLSGIYHEIGHNVKNPDPKGMTKTKTEWAALVQERQKRNLKKMLNQHAELSVIFGRKKSQPSNSLADVEIEYPSVREMELFEVILREEQRADKMALELIQQDRRRGLSAFPNDSGLWRVRKAYEASLLTYIQFDPLAQRSLGSKTNDFASF